MPYMTDQGNADENEVRIRIRDLDNPTSQYGGFRLRRSGVASWTTYSSGSSNYNDGENPGQYTSPTLSYTNGIECGRGYTIYGEAQWNGIWYSCGSVYAYSGECSIVRPNDWNWTSYERSAFNNGGFTTEISYTRWNDFIDRVNEFCDYTGVSRLSSSVKMSSYDRTLYASDFRTIARKIHDMSSAVASECRNVGSGDTVYGWYFINLAEALGYIQ